MATTPADVLSPFDGVFVFDIDGIQTAHLRSSRELYVLFLLLLFFFVHLSFYLLFFTGSGSYYYFSSVGMASHRYYYPQWEGRLGWALGSTGHMPLLLCIAIYLLEMRTDHKG